MQKFTFKDEEFYFDITNFDDDPITYIYKEVEVEERFFKIVDLDFGPIVKRKKKILVDKLFGFNLLSTSNTKQQVYNQIYSVYYSYKEKRAQEIKNGELF